MEKMSSFERVAGNISETEKDEILKNKGRRFNDQTFEELEDKEREKTPEELQIISFINKSTNEVRQRYGIEDFDIPPKNVHVVTEEKWPKEKSSAFFNSMLQAIVMREKSPNIAFATIVFHEMLHFKSYTAAQITTGENPELDNYRLGLRVHTRDGQSMYFVNLNEAVTEEMTKIFIKDLLNNELFVSDIKQTQTLMHKHPHAITASGDPLFDEDTYYAEVQGREPEGESADQPSGNSSSSNVKISTKSFGYKQERRILNDLIDKIFERNQNEFQNREEVFEVFAKGMITGNILPVGRLIEETFENGTLRQIGELDNDIQAQEKFVSSL